jgi:hypothetical protein
MLFWDDSAGSYAFLAPGNSVAITGTTLDTIQDIRTTAAPTFVGVNAVSVFVLNQASVESARWNTTRDYVIGGGGDWGGQSALLGRGLFVQRNGEVESALLNAGGTGARFTGSVAGGTIGGLSATPNSTVSEFAFRTFGGTTWAQTARVQLLTTEPHSETARGTEIIFSQTLPATTALVEVGRFTNLGNFQSAYAISTASPSGGTAQPWKLGNYTAGVVAQAGKVRVEINGTPYDLLTA